MDDWTHVLDRLQAEIANSGRSMKDIAESAGVGYAVVHRLATGQRVSMTLRTVSQIADALGMRIELTRKKRSG